MSMEKFLNGDRVYELWAKIKSALSAKQNVLTAEDGITIEDDAIRVTTPVRGLTQAEYDGIPEEERKGLYIVTDANTALPEGGEVYSTLETRIGTWIDGKPIYRRVIETTIPNATGKWLPAERVDNVDKVIRLDTFVERADLTFPGNFGTHFYVGYLLKESSIGVYIGSNQADYIGRPFYAIIEYTKPTSQGGE